MPPLLRSWRGAAARRGYAGGGIKARGRRAPARGYARAMPKRAGKPERSLPRVLLLKGADLFQQHDAVHRLEEALRRDHGDVDVVRFDGKSAAPADVLDECRTFGLIAAHKLVVLDNAEDLIKEDNRPLFERYAESPSEGATLVLRAAAWRPGRLDKIIEKVGEIIPCDGVNSAQAEKWILTEGARRHRAEIDSDAAAALVALLGPELAAIDSELAKLAAAAGGENPRISAAIIRELVGMRREEEVWAIQSRLLGGDRARTLRHVRDLLDVSGVPTVLMTWAMTDLARKLHSAAAALNAGARPDQLAGPLKLWGESRAAVLSAAGRINIARARRLFRLCVETDHRCKSGFSDSERAVERLALRFAASMK